MKPSQTILLLVVVVVIVFGVTFASMYVAQNKGTPTPKRTGSNTVAEGQLTFPVRVHPENKEEDAQRIVTEYGTKGQHDFWFENTHDGEVRVGLNSRNCTCSEVLLYVAPADWRGKIDRALATRAVAGLDGALPGLLTAACVEQWATDLAGNASQKHDLSDKEEPVIPAGAYGFARLRWQARRGLQMPVKNELLKASLWMQNPRGGSVVDLEASALLVDPLRLDTREFTVGVMGPGDVKQKVVRLWSSTRADLQKPTVEMSGEPFISCGQPEPLTKSDIEELKERGGPVRSGYRMTVTVREQMPNGARIDEGVFTHKVRFRPRERITVVDSLELVLQGTIQGDVTLVGVGSRIDLGEFRVDRGITQRITLQSERDDLKLSVDKFPPFLRATLGEPRQESGVKKWELTVEIAPNKVSGSFPRGDVELYSDSAIYLKMEGPVKRSLRIPVKGNATQ